MFTCSRHVWIGFTFAAVSFWYGIFEWNIFDYPSHAKGPCYSPNHAYYVTRHQTPWQVMTTRSQSEFGTARLFDRSGKLLYENETDINGEFGPEWLSGFENDPMHPPKVFYQGIAEPGWTFTLPESPGIGQMNRNCYPIHVE